MSLLLLVMVFSFHYKTKLEGYILQKMRFKSLSKAHFWDVVSLGSSSVPMGCWTNFERVF